VILVKSVLTAERIEIKLPDTGAVREVIVVLVWLAIDVMVLTNVAHCVAVTVPPALTVDTAD
jgi:hypothetical protein